MTIKKKVKTKACLHSIYWIKIPQLNFFEIFPNFSLVVIGLWLRKLCVSYFISRKTCPINSFLYEWTCFEDGDMASSFYSFSHVVDWVVPGGAVYSM